MKIYLLILLIATAITYLCVPVVRRMARHSGALTPVRDRDVHTIPTPRLGGVAMWIGMVSSFLVASRIPYLSGLFGSGSAIWAVAAGGGAVCLLGVIDDIWDLDWRTKLIGQILAAWLMAWMGIQLVTFPLAGLVIGSSRLSLFVTILIVVVAINAVNFVDGLDGLASGTIAIGSAAFLFYAYGLAREASADDYSSAACVIAAAVVGICLGFLPHNYHPASIFMGDSGAMLLGTVLSGAGILVTGQIDLATVKSAHALPAFLPLVLPIAILMLPLTDMAMAVVRRVKAGHSPFHADRMHVHHRLLRLGDGSQPRAVLTAYLWSAVVAFTAAAFVYFPPMATWAVGSVAIVLAMVITWILLPGFRRRTIPMHAKES